MQRRYLTYPGWVWLLIFWLFIFHKPIAKILFVLEYRQSIVTMSQRYRINPHLLSALIFVESRFNANAQSNKGALGLMQLMPTTGEWAARQLGWSAYHPDDLLDPGKNIQLGTWYLHYLTDYFNNNETLALASYNAGHRYVQEWLDQEVWDGDLVKLESIPFQETKKYLFQIHLIRKIYRYLYPQIAHS